MMQLRTHQLLLYYSIAGEAIHGLRELLTGNASLLMNVSQSVGRSVSHNSIDVFTWR